MCKCWFDALLKYFQQQANHLSKRIMNEIILIYKDLLNTFLLKISIFSSFEILDK